MSAIEIKKGLYWVGVRDPNLTIFDIIMKIENGTTYNSYLIVDDKITLVDTVKEEFTDEYLNNIKTVIGNRKIDYLVVNHTEPDHSGAVEDIINTYKDIKVVASPVGINYLKEMLNRDFDHIKVFDRDVLSLGSRNLEFRIVPNLHWPDTMFTYSEYDRAIFSCDIFGCHYCSKNGEILSSKCDNFSYDFKYYYDVIMAPFKKNVLDAINKISKIDYDIILPSHGPILDELPKMFVKLYEEWSSDNDFKGSKYVLILYASAYGYTKKIAEAIAKGVIKEDFEVEIIDISNHPADDLMPRIERAAAVAVGSPTINKDAVRCVWDVLGRFQPTAIKSKRALTFGSYGWSGEAINFINKRLEDLNFKLINSGFKVKFNPSEKDLEEAFNLGKKLVCEKIEKEK